MKTDTEISKSFDLVPALSQLPLSTVSASILGGGFLSCSQLDGSSKLPRLQSKIKANYFLLCCEKKRCESDWMSLCLVSNFIAVIKVAGRNNHLSICSRLMTGRDSTQACEMRGEILGPCQEQVD